MKKTETRMRYKPADHIAADFAYIPFVTDDCADPVDKARRESARIIGNYEASLRGELIKALNAQLLSQAQSHGKTKSKQPA